MLVACKKYLHLDHYAICNRFKILDCEKIPDVHLLPLIPFSGLRTEYLVLSSNFIFKSFLKNFYNNIIIYSSKKSIFLQCTAKQIWPVLFIQSEPLLIFRSITVHINNFIFSSISSIGTKISF